MADKEHKKIIIKKVKKGGHGGAHGGSWKVAYADFVTAMMAFFLVMWLVNSVTQEKREQIAQYFQSFSLFDNAGKPGLVPSQDLSALNPETTPPPIQPIFESPQGPAQEASQAEIKAEEIKKEIEAKTPDLAKQVSVKTVNDKVIFDLTEDSKGKPLFALGRADLTLDAKRALAAVAPKLLVAGAKLTIEGHTDAYEYSGDKFTNWELSTDRASAARRELEKAGLPADELAAVSGYAATQPFVPDNIYDPRNRRIRLVLEVPPKPGEKPQGQAGANGAGQGQTAGQTAPGKTPDKTAKPEEPPVPASPIPKEKREILDQRMDNLYDAQTRGKL